MRGGGTNAASRAIRSSGSRTMFVCIVDVAVRDEQAVLQRLALDRQASLAPDTS
jgi:hypothetical protein